MRFLRNIALLAGLMVPAALAHGQISVGVGIGGPVYGPAPVCSYGYYNSYPYACAPYGYYGPEWFDGGLFIGVGPWYRGYGYRGYGGGYGFRGGYGYGGGYRGGYGYGGAYRGGYGVRGGEGFHGNVAGGGYRGNGGTGFHGGSAGAFHGGGSYRGGGGHR